MIGFRHLLGNPGPCPIGLAVKLPSLELVEVWKLAGFDFLLLDLEHSMMSLREADSLLALASALELPCLVRLPDHGNGYVQKVLDAGAGGIFIPHVTDARVCETVISQALHPPRGSRGAGAGMRAGGWGLASPRVDYLDDGERAVARIPMIEDSVAVKNADEIAQVPGVDALFVGRGDIALAMGVPATDTAVKALAIEVLRQGKTYQVPVGTVAFGTHEATELIDAGFNFVLAGSDVGMLGSASRRMIETIRRDSGATQ